MIRALIMSSLVASLIVPSAALANKSAGCKKIGALTAELYELRLEGHAEMDALLEMAERHKDEKPELLQLLPSVNPWVYSLEDDLNAEDVGAAMTEQCLAA